jgi:hypothetical protein
MPEECEQAGVDLGHARVHCLALYMPRVLANLHYSSEQTNSCKAQPGQGST